MDKLLNPANLLTIGAGGISFLFVIAMLWYLVKELHPLLTQLNNDNNLQTEVIRNNTAAIHEISKSNENVAESLRVVDRSFGSMAKLLEKHDQRAECIEKEFLQLKGHIIRHLD